MKLPIDKRSIFITSRKNYSKFISNCLYHKQRIGSIYCRVSSSSKKQLYSLAAQASGLARRVATQHLWKLEDAVKGKSENISWGIRRQMESGSSKIYDRVSFGYDHDADGHLVIREDQAVVVRKIFMLYLVGNSVLKIKRARDRRNGR